MYEMVPETTFWSILISVYISTKDAWAADPRLLQDSIIRSSGESFFLTCQIDSDVNIPGNTSRLVWCKEKIEMEGIELNNWSGYPRAWNYTVTHAVPSDTGFYTCHFNSCPEKNFLTNSTPVIITGTGGSEETSTSFTKTISTSPEAAIEVQNSVINTGDPFLLKCKTTQPTSVVFCKDDVLMENQVTGQPKIVITNATLSDGGKYSCGIGSCNNSTYSYIQVIPQGNSSRICGSDGQWKETDIGNCILEQVVKASNEINKVFSDNATVLEIETTVNNTLSQLEKVYEKDEATSGDLDKTVDVLNKIANISVLRNNTLPTNKFLSTMDNILANNYSSKWQHNKHKLHTKVSKILSTVSLFGTAVLKTVKQNQSVTFNKTKNLEMTIAKTTSNSRIAFPEHVTRDVTSSFTLPPQNNVDKSLDVSYVAVRMKTIAAILSAKDSAVNTFNSTTKINSDVLSLSIHGKVSTKRLDPDLKLQFPRRKTGILHSREECVFWDFGLGNGGGWSTHGCVTSEINKNTTECSCDHLTNFAILLRPYTKTYVGKDDDVINLISIIGCSISVGFALMTTVIFILLWKNLKSDVNRIIISLCISIAAAYSLFIGGVDRTNSEVACTIITAFLHYFFLTVFSLMFALGYYYFVNVPLVTISLKASNKITSRSRVKLVLVLVWGVPVLVTGVTIGSMYALERDYHLPNACWLSYESGALFGFIGPVALIILVNFMILVSLFWAMKHRQFKSNKSSVKKKALNGIKNISTLLPLFGITWLFGLLSINDEVVIFQYIFAVLNSLQGLFLFISNCILNQKVRRLLTKTVCRKKTSKFSQSSHKTHSETLTSNRDSRDHEIRFDAKKNRIPLEKDCKGISYDKRKSTRKSEI